MTRELFDRANEAMSRKSKPRKRKHDFAFTGLITCGSCGGSITASAAKAQYVYYHCAAKCDAVAYIPEAEVSKQLGEPLRRIQLSEQIVQWTREALMESHAEQAAEHTAAVDRLTLRKKKLSSYMEQAYQDRVEGLISTDMWERKTAEWRTEAEAVDRELALRGEASHLYAVEGIKLLELAQRAYSLYESQPPREQRALLEIVLSNCVLEGRSVRISLRKPFDLMLDCTEIENWRALVADFGTALREHAA
ncbi:MAG: recombinase zinc beta ribbon domain-containing protein [Deltaproteobacteria bacterium]|nr:recombinase zinc beta ribbon domain-containing protein [Deltaproteobacteria bacterium]